MKRRRIMVMSIFLVTVLMFSSATSFAGVNELSEEKFIKIQMDNLKQGIDYEQLKLDAINGVDDFEVPQHIRSEIVVTTDFIPNEGISKNALDLQTYSTVQKIGEVRGYDGDTEDVYITLSGVDAQDSEIRSDIAWDNSLSLNPAKVWICLIWIDHYGIENEIDEVRAEFTYGNYSCSDKLVEYGEISRLNPIEWTQHWAYSPYITNPTYSDRGVIGFRLAACASMSLGGYGTLAATAHSSIADIW